VRRVPHSGEPPALQCSGRASPPGPGLMLLGQGALSLAGLSLCGWCQGPPLPFLASPRGPPELSPPWRPPGPP